MRTMAVFKRVVLEMLRDRRTLVMMLIGPLVILTLIWVMFQSNATQKTTLAVQNVNSSLVDSMHNSRLKIVKLKKDNRQSARKIIRQHDYAGVLREHNNRLTLTLQNSTPSQSTLIRQSLNAAKVKLALKTQTKIIKQQQSMISQLIAQMPQSMTSTGKSINNLGNNSAQKVRVHYLYGDSDSTYFDTIFPIMIGFVVFLFVFLISGMALLRERTRGTLDRVLATPIRRGELISGYILGYGLFALLQTLIIVGFSIWIFKLQVLGSLWTVFLINIVIAVMALSMGLFISSFADSEFQMMEFVPLIAIPQVLFSGIIPFSTMPEWLRVIGHLMPLYYGSTAMTNVIEKGYTLSQVGGSILILLFFAILFIWTNMVSLKKYRPV